MLRDAYLGCGVGKPWRRWGAKNRAAVLCFVCARVILDTGETKRVLGRIWNLYIQHSTPNLAPLMERACLDFRSREIIREVKKIKAHALGL